MRYKDIARAFSGDLCTYPDAVFVWLFMLGQMENGMVESPRPFIAACTGLSNERLDAAINKITSLGWIALAYGPHRNWGWYVTEKAPVRILTARLPVAEWRELKSYIFARDDYTCAYCGERGGNLECDHIVPISKGGDNEIDNLVTACKSCNRSKHTMPADLFKQRRSKRVQQTVC